MLLTAVVLLCGVSTARAQGEIPSGEPDLTGKVVRIEAPTGYPFPEITIYVPKPDGYKGPTYNNEALVYVNRDTQIVEQRGTRLTSVPFDRFSLSYGQEVKAWFKSTSPDVLLIVIDTQPLIPAFQLTLSGNVPSSDGFAVMYSVTTCADDGACTTSPDVRILSLCGDVRPLSSELRAPCGDKGTVYSAVGRDVRGRDKLNFSFIRVSTGRPEYFHTGAELQLVRPIKISASYQYNDAHQHGLPDSLPDTGGAGMARDGLPIGSFAIGLPILVAGAYVAQRRTYGPSPRRNSSRLRGFEQL